MMMMIRVKRAYDSVEKDDGVRILVDRLWPRGLKKEQLSLYTWLRDVAPSDDLRKWFGHEPARWEEFKERYFSELDQKQDALKPLSKAALDGNVTLIYAAQDKEYNNAVALKEYMEARRKK